MRRRDFLAGLAAAAMIPRVSGAQQTALPVIAFVNGGSADGYAAWLARFIRALNETGLVEGRDFTVEYHWLEGQYSGLPALMTDLAHRRVAVIAMPGLTVATFAAKAATATIPIVFGISEDPVRLGLVASLARPGGNATGINYFQSEAIAKRLGLLHALVPKAVRIAALVNPVSKTITEATLQALQRAAGPNGLQIQVLKATTSREIDAAFNSLGHDRPDAIFVAPDHSSEAAACNWLPWRRATDPVAYGDRDLCRSGRADELRRRWRGDVLSGWPLHRPHPERSEARRSAGRPIDQVRVRHQPANGASAWHRSATKSACNHRRSNRLAGPRLEHITGPRSCDDELPPRATSPPWRPTLIASAQLRRAAAMPHCAAIGQKVSGLHARVH